jgi:hypothetical protein
MISPRPIGWRRWMEVEITWRRLFPLSPFFTGRVLG